jgi:hypothetical protein
MRGRQPFGQCINITPPCKYMKKLLLMTVDWKLRNFVPICGAESLFYGVGALTTRYISIPRHVSADPLAVAVTIDIYITAILPALTVFY